MHLQGNLLDLLVVFIAGVLVSFTPCVYPVMPLTVSCIAGANVRGSRLRSFILSLIFVLGMALTYCTLAMVAALTGKIFGQFQNQPFMYGIIAGLLCIFSLVMFDVIKLPQLGFHVQVNKDRPRTMMSVFLLGAASGLVVGPCTAPVLGTLLIYISTKANLFYGTLLMFLFSYGVGFSLILVGTFSGMISTLPRSGVWMVRIKQVCGLIILGIAVVFFLKALGIL